MNALYKVVLCLIQSAALTGCCSVEKIKMTVDNASILCKTDVSCVAECYPGFIFSSGQTKQSYGCLNGVWSPVLSTCKRIPVISVTYLVIWKIDNAVPSNCANISKRLNSTAEMLKGTLTFVCRELTINSTEKFTYSMNGSLVKGNLIAEYSNFTSMDTVDICIDVVINSVSVKTMLGNMFQNVFCNDLSLMFEVKKNLSVEKRYEYCNNGTQLQIVREVSNGKEIDEHYCDFAITETTTPMISPEISSKSSIKKSTLSETDLGLPDTDDLHTYETNTDDMKLSNGGLDKESKIYIAAAGGGFFLISIIIIFAVYRQKRCKSSLKTREKIDMVNFVENEGINNSFKGELTENELYQSADNVVDSKNNTYSDSIEHGSK